MTQNNNGTDDTDHANRISDLVNDLDHAGGVLAENITAAVALTGMDPEGVAIDLWALADHYEEAPEMMDDADSAIIGVNASLAVKVGEAWARTDVPQSKFATMLRSIANVYHPEREPRLTPPGTDPVTGQPVTYVGIRGVREDELSRDDAAEITGAVASVLSGRIKRKIARDRGVPVDDLNLSVGILAGDQS